MKNNLSYYSTVKIKHKSFNLTNITNNLNPNWVTGFCDAESSYVVYKFSDITTKIIPFFEEYSLRVNKILDFYDFKRVTIVGEINKYDKYSFKRNYRNKKYE